jgi:signal transduction histidine kinase
MDKQAHVYQIDSHGRRRRWSGLRNRMTLSYVWVTVGVVIVLEILAGCAVAIAVISVVLPSAFTTVAHQTARQYALLAALQGKGSSLDPQSTFLPGKPGTLAIPNTDPDHPLDNLYVPYTASRVPATRAVEFALLIAPSGNILASSYPQRYPGDKLATIELPDRAMDIAHALAGVTSGGIGMTAAGRVAYAIEPIWSLAKTPLGAVYVQLPVGPSSDGATSIWPSLASLLVVSGLVLLVVVAPIGGLFGALTTRTIICRIRRLSAATAQFAGGDYAQRIPISTSDEIGQLEGHFNHMARQLEESIAASRDLAEQNARLAERSRITRELHDAISQDLFSLRMLVDGMQHAATVASPTQSLLPYLHAMADTTSSVIREMRALLLELRPIALEGVSLAIALAQLARTYQDRLDVVVTTEIAEITLAQSTEHALLRIAQEALNNAIRHGHATAIQITLAAGEQHISFDIADNGTGFIVAEEGDHQGLGLRFMRERVAEIHGTMRVDSTAGRGTQLHISIPQEGDADGHSRAHR